MEKTKEYNILLNMMKNSCYGTYGQKLWLNCTKKLKQLNHGKNN